MTSRRKTTLAERQFEMLKRRRPQRVKALTVAKQEKLRRRIAGIILLRKGYTAEQLSAALHVNLASVRAWIGAGKPLL